MLVAFPGWGCCVCPENIINECNIQDIYHYWSFVGQSKQRRVTPWTCNTMMKPLHMPSTDKFLNSCISGPIDMEQKWSKSVGCWAHNVTLVFGHTHGLDHRFSRSYFQITVSQEWEGRLTLNKRDVSQSWMTRVTSDVSVLSTRLVTYPCAGWLRHWGLHITMTSWWARWRLKSAASWLFTQPFIQGADQRKHKSSGSLAFVRGIHRSPVNSPHKRPVTRKMLPFDDVIMQILHPRCYDVRPTWSQCHGNSGMQRWRPVSCLGRSKYKRLAIRLTWKLCSLTSPSTVTMDTSSWGRICSYVVTWWPLKANCRISGFLIIIYAFYMWNVKVSLNELTVVSFLSQKLKFVQWMGRSKSRETNVF